MLLPEKRLELARKVAEHASGIAKQMAQAGLSSVWSQEHDIQLNLTTECSEPETLCFEGSNYDLLDTHEREPFQIDTEELVTYAKNLKSIEKIVKLAIEKEFILIDEAIRMMGEA